MEELLEYRQRMVDRLAGSGSLLERAILLFKDPFLPLEPGGWNLHQVVTHLRDVNQQVYLPRLHRVLNEENPLFMNFDGETWMTEHYQPQEPLQKILAEFDEQCRTSSAWLSDLNNEAWNRSGKHPTIGVHSLQWWVERMLAHIAEHLTQLNPRGEEQ
jgi:hypothetical protein